jgi:Spy/CpxP family protein refolding chaperone
MRRMAYLSVAAAVFVSLSVAATHSQTGGSGRAQGGGSAGGSGGTFGPGAAPDDFGREMAQQQAEHQREFQQRMEEMQRKAEEMQRQAEESRNRAIQEALRATDEQWRHLKPTLDRIEQLKAEAEVAVDAGSLAMPPGFQGGGMAFGGTWGFGSASGGMGASGFSTGPNGRKQSQYRTWSWGQPSATKSPMDMTPGEVLCGDLSRLLQSPSIPAAQVAQKVESLRQLRAQARADLAKARTELRSRTAPHQEPILVALGYLD